MKKAKWIALWVVSFCASMACFVWGMHGSQADRRAEAAATARCVAFCRDVEAVAVDGGVCACPARDGGPRP